MKEANNANLFANPSEISKPSFVAKTANPAIETGKENNADGSPVVEVRFCTGGRLSAPPFLHFRDYTLQASQLISEFPTSEDHLPLLCKVLNSMVVEDFDCGYLHLEEAKEVLINVHGKWWGNTLNGFRYLLNPEIEEQNKLLAPENISIADIPLSAINVVPLSEDIHEPINITIHGVTVKFVYPRIRNAGIIDDLIKTQFADEEQQFFRIKQMIEYNIKQTDPEKKKDVNLKESNEYSNYLAERAKWRVIYMRAQEICGIDNESFETLEERINVIQNDKRISVRHWQAYTDFLNGKGKFGVKDEAEFYSDILNQKVTRPFLFRSWTLMPGNPVVGGGYESASIHFG
jgi:hypothetical protein